MSEAHQGIRPGGASVTTPGGVPNLPQGALTLETLASNLQDMSGTAMKSRAVARFPSIFENSTGLSPASDITPFGILTRIWAEVNSLIANADPADIQGPEDLPPLVLEFIEGLPVVGQFIDLLQAILGRYDGDDDTLKAIQLIFAPIRKLVQLLSGGIHVGSLTAARPNLVPPFTAGSISDNPDWDDDGTGGAVITFDGRYHALRSGQDPSDRVEVGVGQTISETILVDLTDYSGVGDPPFLLQIVPFLADVRDAPVTLASYAPQSASVTGYEMSGEYEVPEGVTSVQFRLLITDGALAGVGRFYAPEMVQDFDIQPGKTLTGLFDNVDARRQALLDALYNKLTGSTGIGHTLPELFDSLDDIPGDLIRGLFGPGTMPDTIKKFVDAVVSGAVGETGTGADFADVETFIGLLSSWATQGRFAWEQAGIRNNRPVDSGFYPSERSNFPLSAITTQFTIAPGTSLIAFDYVEESMALGVISWIGWGIAGITEFYVNSYLVDLATGNLGELIHQSPNVVGVLGGTDSPGAFMTYELTDPPPLKVGELIAYEMITVGGTHTVRGRVSGLPVHPTAPIGAPAATRTVGTPASPPATLPKASLTWSQNVPWVGIAVDTGSGSDHHDPLPVVLDKPTSIPIPNWANKIDVVLMPRGGDASDGFVGFYGNPGHPGSFNEVTFSRGTHFSGTSTIIAFDGTEVSIPGYSLTGIPGANGVGARAIVFGKPVGQGPGTRIYNGLKAIAGTDQTALGADGAGAGGAANGGTAFGLYSKGGNGGPSRAWIQFRKDPLPGETPGTGTGDTTPPDISGMTVEIESTFNSIIITPSGAVDA
jgi:hypothetical protein